MIRDFADAQEIDAKCLGLDAMVQSHQIVEKLANAIIMFKMKGASSNMQSKN
jgi:hypothetical protein